MTNGPTADPTPAAPEERGPNRALLIAVGVLLLAGVAVAAYFIGRSAADADAAEQRGIDKGRAAVQRQYEEGAPGYQQIYEKGRQAGLTEGRRSGERAGAEQGKKVGLEQGKEIGQLEGEREGIEQGSTAALGGLSDWETGSWYLVKFATGEQGVAFRVQSRKQMSDKERYAICADNPSDICTEPIPAG